MELENNYSGMPTKPYGGAVTGKASSERQNLLGSNDNYGYSNTPKYQGVQAPIQGPDSYVTNQSASNAILPSEHLSGQIIMREPGNAGGHQSSFSPVMQTNKQQHQRKPPLPSPFMTKMEGSHSKLALYSNNTKA